MNYIIGIDEAGRGAWAGPVVAGGWMAVEKGSWDVLATYTGLTDSKKLTPRKREAIFLQIEDSESEGKCHTKITSRSAEEIDRVGIREANRQCMEEIILSFLSRIREDDYVEIFIDGCDNYRFDLGDRNVGYEFSRLSIKEKSETMPSGREKIKFIYRIGGDSTIAPVSAASIVAKVLRDRKMCEFHEYFPEYGFSLHKGYGTKRHHNALIYHGISSIHRKSYAPMKVLISKDS